jgi:hypothetical protein
MHQRGGVERLRDEDDAVGAERLGMVAERRHFRASSGA